MKILVTGALGHIGSKLIKDLSNINNIKNIYLIDDLRTQRFNSLMHLSKKGKYKFYDETLSKENLNLLVKKSDFIIHLAAITDAASSFGKFNQLKKNNLDNTKLVTYFCSKYKKKLIFISSTSVYGSNDKIMYEDENNLNPQSPYAKIKISEEKYINKFIKEKKINAVILRFGTILGYSIGMRFHTAVNKFCYNTILKKDVPIWNNAIDQYRPYLSLNDAINVMIFIINKKIFNNQIYNILTGNYTVRQILNIIKKNCYKIRIKKTKSPILNQNSYKVSSKKFERFNFSFRRDLSSDIKNTLNLLKYLY